MQKHTTTIVTCWSLSMIGLFLFLAKLYNVLNRRVYRFRYICQSKLILTRVGHIPKKVTRRSFGGFFGPQKRNRYNF